MVIMENSNFKSRNTFDERKTESIRVRNKYPNRVPVILEYGGGKINKNFSEIYKIKYLIPHDMTISQFLFILRKKIKLDHSTGIYLFIHPRGVFPEVQSAAVSPVGNCTIGKLYNDYKDDDGFLYILYSGENTFG